MKKVSRRRDEPVPAESSGPRESILAAALQAFARFGYDGTSMPRIAKMASVAPPLIHYYFGSKDKLWRETVEYSLGKLRREAAAIGVATRALAPLDRLRALLQAYAHFAAHWPDHFFMTIAEARLEGDRFAWVEENYTGVLFDDVVQLLEEAKQKGQINDIAINELAVLLIGGMMLYFTIYMHRPTDKSLDEQADDYTDMIFKLLDQGIRIKG